MNRPSAFEDPKQDELDTKIMRSSAWAVLGFGGGNALALISTLVLVRLLVPEEFGVVAIAMAILAVAQIVQESGLGAALIVHRGDMRRAAASVMVFAPLVATALYAGFFVAAPLAAEFFDEPRLTDVVRVLAITLLLRGLTTMPLALLERQMRFLPLTAIQLGAGLAQATTAIGLAVAGAGFWSLVAGQLAFAAATLGLAWAYSPLRPSPFEASLETLRELIRFGRHVGLANLIRYGNANAHGIVLGRVLGATALGYYTIAYRLAYMPVSVIGIIVGRGVFAALSHAVDDPARFRRIWLENIQRRALLATPAAIGLALVADPFVEVFLGEAWEPATVPLQILALASVVLTFSATSGEVAQALRRPKMRVVWEAAYVICVVPAMILGALWHGIVGAALGFFLVHAVLGVGIVVFIAHLLGVRRAELIHAIARPALGWGLMAGAILALYPLLDEQTALVTLIGLTVAGAGVYGVIVTLFARDMVITMWVNLRGARPSG